jgi:hypothetical protein
MICLRFLKTNFAIGWPAPRSLYYLVSRLQAHAVHGDDHEQAVSVCASCTSHPCCSYWALVVCAVRPFDVVQPRMWLGRSARSKSDQGKMRPLSFLSVSLFDFSLFLFFVVCTSIGFGAGCSYFCPLCKDEEGLVLSTKGMSQLHHLLSQTQLLDSVLSSFGQSPKMTALINLPYVISPWSLSFLVMFMNITGERCIGRHSIKVPALCYLKTDISLLLFISPRPVQKEVGSAAVNWGFRLFSRHSRARSLSQVLASDCRLSSVIVLFFFFFRFLRFARTFPWWK